MAFSISLLVVLIVFNFYGLFTNKFYFYKVDNYIFPLLTIVHFSFLQSMQLKINTRIFGDLQLRNLEYAMYAILMVYIFKALDTGYILVQYWDYETQVMPETFVPFGIAILGLQSLLVVMTILAFLFRRRIIGKYNFDHINDKLDSWQ